MTIAPATSCGMSVNATTSLLLALAPSSDLPKGHHIRLISTGWKLRFGLPVTIVPLQLSRIMNFLIFSMTSTARSSHHHDTPCHAMSKKYSRWVGLRLPRFWRSAYTVICSIICSSHCIEGLSQKVSYPCRWLDLTKCCCICWCHGSLGVGGSDLISDSRFCEVYPPHLLLSQIWNYIFVEHPKLIQGSILPHASQNVCMSTEFMPR